VNDVDWQSVARDLTNCLGQRNAEIERLKADNDRLGLLVVSLAREVKEWRAAPICTCTPASSGPGWVQSGAVNQTCPVHKPVFAANHGNEEATST
jgi:hypothetical protein